ncbi:MAG: ribosome biogenesis GTPase Der [Deltaproteobacteria bacterium]|nr:ribosome biogenesis GTPase Der [Deltaproteobacteria bacterium]
MMRPIVAIVGRPNAGKSTLFNRLLGRRKAIVGDEPGVTRDLNFADTEEFGRAFTLVDTGGFEPKSTDVILTQVKAQMRLAIEESDVIVFLMDGRGAPAAGDAELVRTLRKSGKSVVYAVNKIDTPARKDLLADFYSLGVSPLLAVSAEHGLGLDDLVDAVIEKLPVAAPEDAAQDRTRIAIVGRPNVGKSSLLNMLIGRERSIVSPIAGTTRDAVDTPFEHAGKGYLFVDTAGIRRKSRVAEAVESYSVMEAIRSIDRSDAAMLVMDGSAGLTTQDEKIAGIIADKGKSCVIVVNKWDIVEKDAKTADHVKERIREGMHFLSYAPVVFVSALTGQRVANIFGVIDMVAAEGRTRIPTSRLNEAVAEITARHPPGAWRGKEVKFYYATQTSVSPPTFVFFSNRPEGVEDGYMRYLASSLREYVGLHNCPVRIFIRKKE